MKVPDPLSLNLYTYTHNNPLYFQDPSGHFVISTTVLVAIGLAAVGAVVGGFIGNHIANKVNAASQDRWKYIAGGAVAGTAVGATVGYLVGPAIASATGIGGISVTSSGISTVAVGGQQVVEKTVQGVGNWSNGIKATQEVISGTNVPKSFVLEGKVVNGNELWVHGNATKHMGEFINSAKGSILVENELMMSFKNSVTEILPKVQAGRNFPPNVNGWEIGIDGTTGVIYHALFK